jgi:phosphoribosylaminoimidazole-succinocarboxamide synthase
MRETLAESNPRDRTDIGTSVRQRSPGEVILAATDRVSFYDVVLPRPIPDKGELLMGRSLWWFEQLADRDWPGRLLVVCVRGCGGRVGVV